MGGRGRRGQCPFRDAVLRWRAVPGGIDPDGRPVTEPAELTEARWILRQCERFGCLPSQLMREDAGLLRLLRLEELAGPDPGLMEGGEHDRE